MRKRMHASTHMNARTLHKEAEGGRRSGVCGGAHLVSEQQQPYPRKQASKQVPAAARPDGAVPAADARTKGTHIHPPIPLPLPPSSAPTSIARCPLFSPRATH
jgi:hypothetical protein